MSNIVNNNSNNNNSSSSSNNNNSSNTNNRNTSQQEIYKRDNIQQQQQHNHQMNVLHPVLTTFPSGFQHQSLLTKQYLSQGGDFSMINPSSSSSSSSASTTTLSPSSANTSTNNNNSNIGLTNFPLLQYKAEQLSAILQHHRNSSELSGSLSEPFHVPNRFSSNIGAAAALTPMNATSFPSFFAQQSLLSPLSHAPVMMQPFSSLLSSPASQIHVNNLPTMFPSSYKMGYRLDTHRKSDLSELSQEGRKRKSMSPSHNDSPSGFIGHREISLPISATTTTSSSSSSSSASTSPAHTGKEVKIVSSDRVSIPLHAIQPTPAKKKRKGPYLRSACVACYEEKVKCCPSNTIDENGLPGPCERCILKNRKCVKVLERKRGRKSKKELAGIM